MPHPEPNEVIDGLIAQIDTLKASLGAVEDERNRLNTRCYELERTRELFQERRDQAVREQREADEALGKVIGHTPFVESVLAARPQPGSLVIIRAPEFESDEDKAAFQACMSFIARQHPEWTLLLTHPGKDIQVEALAETAMRAKGWIREEKIAPGPRVLESACGAYRVALEKAVEYLRADKPQDRREALGLKIAEILAQPLPTVQPEAESPAPAGEKSAEGAP